MKIRTALLLLLSLTSTAWADNALEYSQKKLKNGDIECTYRSADGTKLVQVQHKDGSIESLVTQETKDDKNKEENTVQPKLVQ